MATKVKSKDSGKLRIGDDWNAIRIIALSQSNPLKAIAEFVENSIDAQAKNIAITRGREHGAHYLSIKDDGDGVPRDADGLPDFKYVATHICDSIKKAPQSRGQWHRDAGRVWHWSSELLDGRRYLGRYEVSRNSFLPASRLGTEGRVIRDNTSRAG